MRERLAIARGLDGALWRLRGSRHHLVTHRHSELEFNLVVRGTARYLIGDRRYDLQHNSMVWLFPGQEHVLVGMSPDFDMLIGVFKRGLVWRSCRDTRSKLLRQFKPAGWFCRQLGPERALWLNRLCAELADPGDQHEPFNAGLGFLLLGAWHAFSAAPRRMAQALHPAVEAAARLLAEANEPLSLGQVAAAVRLSGPRLSRLFKRHAGVSLVHFRQQQQLERFLNLYRDDGTCTMLDAALRAGFGSYPQFHRVFRSHFGEGPAAYYRQ